MYHKSQEIEIDVISRTLCELFVLNWGFRRTSCTFEPGKKVQLLLRVFFAFFVWKEIETKEMDEMKVERSQVRILFIAFISESIRKVLL